MFKYNYDRKRGAGRTRKMLNSVLAFIKREIIHSLDNQKNIYIVGVNQPHCDSLFFEMVDILQNENINFKLKKFKNQIYIANYNITINCISVDLMHEKLRGIRDNYVFYDHYTLESVYI